MAKLSKEEIQEFKRVMEEWREKELTLEDAERRARSFDRCLHRLHDWGLENPDSTLSKN